MAIIVALVMLLPGDQANDFDSLLHDAESAFRAGLDSAGSPEQARGHFRRAEHLCARLADEGVSTPTLYRNLGNAALLAGDIPQAILAYRRGLAIAPGDRVLHANLSYARSQVDSRPDAKRPTDGFIAWSSFWVFSAAYLLYILACLFLTLWWGSRKSAYLCVGLVGLLIALPIFLALGRSGSEADGPIAVIARDETYLHKGNGFAYPRLEEGPLQRGAETRLLAARNGWLKIELASGSSGWIPEKAAVY
jgi:tetratricopeptide (TPR) repeat protein